jgi:hypothetical protein
VSGLRWRVHILRTALAFASVTVLSACGAGGGQNEGEQADQQENGGQQQEELDRQQQELDQQRQEIEELQQRLEDEQQEQGSDQQQRADNGTQRDEAAGSGGSNAVYQVGDAGEVELRVDNGRLVLVEARPNEGWRVEDIEEEADEVDLDFVRGNVEWEFEAELEDGELQVETERDTDD